MGILNVTPDSFSDGGVHADPDMAVARALEIEARGRIFSISEENPAVQEAFRSRRRRNCDV